MKNYWIVFLITIPFQNSAVGQTDFDRFWLLGVGEELIPAIKNGGCLVDFAASPPTKSYFQSSAFWGTGSCSNICSKNGVPLFYLNGCKVWDFNGTPSVNGDSINFPGPFWENNCYTSSTGTGFEAHAQGMLILPFPAETNKYVIFHLWADGLHYNCRALFQTTVEAKENSQSIVISKNNTLMLDSLSDGISAVKHGNGRDWWVFNTVLGSEYAYLTQLAPQGVKASKQVFGLGYWAGGDENDGFLMGQSTFSPDGNLFARIDLLNDNGLQIAHFDRCAGEFSSPTHLPWKIYPSNLDNYPGDAVYACGVAFSPNSRFLYVSTGERLYQFDMWSTDIPNSWVMVGKYDGFGSPLSATFNLLQSAPNGKIYMNATNSLEYLHVINNPDEEGLACNFENHGFELLTRNGFSMPNFPNFKLLDLSNSPCDTLGISAINDDFESNESQKLVLSPNPVDDKAKMELPDGRNRRISIFSILGKLVNQFDIQDGRALVYLDTKILANGSYFIVVQSENKPTLTTRMIVVH